MTALRVGPWGWPPLGIIALAIGSSTGPQSAGAVAGGVGGVAALVGIAVLGRPALLRLPIVCVALMCLLAADRAG